MADLGINTDLLLANQQTDVETECVEHEKALVERSDAIRGLHISFLSTKDQVVEPVRVQSASLDPHIRALWAAFGKGFDHRVGSAFNRVLGACPISCVVLSNLDLGRC